MINFDDVVSNISSRLSATGWPPSPCYPARSSFRPSGQFAQAARTKCPTWTSNSSTRTSCSSPEQILFWGWIGENQEPGTVEVYQTTQDDNRTRSPDPVEVSQTTPDEPRTRSPDTVEVYLQTTQDDHRTRSPDTVGHSRQHRDEPRTRSPDTVEVTPDNTGRTKNQEPDTVEVYLQTTRGRTIEPGARTQWKVSSRQHRTNQEPGARTQ